MPTVPTQLNCIPQPVIVEFVGPDVYNLARTTITVRVANDEGLLQKAKVFQRALQQRFGAQSTLIVDCSSFSAVQPPSADIRLVLVDHLVSLDQFRWPHESYELKCDAEGIMITAITATGAFYGMQTLLQALQFSTAGLAMPYTKVKHIMQYMSTLHHCAC